MIPRSTRSPGVRLQERVTLAATVVLLTAVYGWLQFSFDGLYDTDSYFHTRAAEQLAAHGIERIFPQAAFSTWAERYSDKDFLFHVLLIPFVTVLGDLTQAGKVPATG